MAVDINQVVIGGVVVTDPVRTNDVVRFRLRTRQAATTLAGEKSDRGGEHPISCRHALAERVLREVRAGVEVVVNGQLRWSVYKGNDIAEIRADLVGVPNCNRQPGEGVALG